MATAKNKSELEDIIQQLKEEILRLKGETKQEFKTDKNTKYAFGISVKNGQYHVVEVAYNFKDGTSQIIGSTQAKNPKNYHTVKIALQDAIYEKVLRNLEVIEA